MLQLDKVCSWKELRLELIALMELSTLQNQARDSKLCSCQRQAQEGPEVVRSMFENKQVTLQKQAKK